MINLWNYDTFGIELRGADISLNGSQVKYLSYFREAIKQTQKRI